jgi:membrane protease YdiL (CAAX protease family)
MPWWGAVLTALVLLVTLQAVLTMAGTVQAVGQGIRFAEGMRLATLDPLNLALAHGLACAAAVVVGLRWRAEPGLRGPLRVVPVPHAVVALAFVAGLAAQIPLAEVQNILDEVWPIPMEHKLRMRQLLTADDLWNGLAILLAVVVVAPVGEELVFRGTMLSGLDRRYGPRRALLLTALLFGLLHASPAAFTPAVPATVAGVLLGALVLHTGSVLPAIALHAGVNAVPVLVPEHVMPIEGVNTLAPEVYHVPLPLLLLSGLVTAGALLGVMWLSDRSTP